MVYAESKGLSNTNKQLEKAVFAGEDSMSRTTQFVIPACRKSVLRMIADKPQ